MRSLTLWGSLGAWLVATLTVAVVISDRAEANFSWDYFTAALIVGIAVWCSGVLALLWVAASIRRDPPPTGNRKASG